MPKNDIIELIQKLIEHESSARAIGSIAEAEAFASRIQALLLKHKLEMSDIEIAEQEQNEPMANELLTEQELTDQIAPNNKKSNWVGILLWGVAIANFCDVVAAAKKNMYHLLGRESDREVTKRMFKYLYDAAIEVAEKEAKAYRLTESYRNQLFAGKRPGTVVNTFISGFKLGFAITVKRRLSGEREKARQQLESGSVGAALIRLDQIELQIKQFVKEQFPKVSSGCINEARNRDGFERGKQYGSQIGINATKRLN